MSNLTEIGLKDQNARLDAKNWFPLFRSALAFKYANRTISYSAMRKSGRSARVLKRLKRPWR
ncbi:hypothetical protein C5688_05680 [Methylocystis sp. MitZ-2018]|nr:hypothetical protein C5688_05680 [Methylocystis sp. MitZ-2018]